MRIRSKEDLEKIRLEGYDACRRGGIAEGHKCPYEWVPGRYAASAWHYWWKGYHDYRVDEERANHPGHRELDREMDGRIVAPNA